MRPFFLFPWRTVCLASSPWRNAHFSWGQLTNEVKGDVGYLSLCSNYTYTVISRVLVLLALVGVKEVLYEGVIRAAVPVSGGPSPCPATPDLATPATGRGYAILSRSEHEHTRGHYAVWSRH